VGDEGAGRDGRHSAISCSTLASPVPRSPLCSRLLLYITLQLSRAEQSRAEQQQQQSIPSTYMKIQYSPVRPPLDPFDTLKITNTPVHRWGNRTVYWPPRIYILPRPQFTFTRPELPRYGHTHPCDPSRPACRRQASLVPSVSLGNTAAPPADPDVTPLVVFHFWLRFILMRYLNGRYYTYRLHVYLP
jgi:hypothetical protein